MTTLAAAFILAWGAVAAYLSWLGRNQRRLWQQLEALGAADEPQDAQRRKAA